MRWVALGAALALFLAPHPAATQFLFCTPPREPACARFGAEFRDRWEFDSCRQEVEQFRQRMRTYLACLEDEREEAIHRVNRAIDAFNAKARR